MLTAPVVFDADCTVGCGEERCNRPGIGQLFEVLHAAGHSVVLWSRSGADHARLVAERSGIAGLVDAYRSKPDHPMRAGTAAGALGVVPMMTVDDDPAEEIPGVSFVHVSGRWHADAFATRGDST